MIRYALACDNGHPFESWFPSSGAFDAQAERGLVECPVCGSKEVRKALMAPALGRSAPAAAAPSPASAESPTDPVPAGESAAPQPVAVLSERERAVRAMLRAVREHVVKTADYVGSDFPEQARRMHYGEAEHRSIYGEATPLDAKALLEEGIEVQPLPAMPDDRN